MDMATLMGMFGGGGGAAAPQGGMQMPQAQLGAAQMGGPQQSPGFGLGQQAMMGQMGDAQMAQPQTMMGKMQDMLGQAQGSMTPEMMAKLGPMAAQLMQMHQGQQQQAPMMAMPMQGAMQQPQTQAQRGYLAQGGGMAQRNRGY